MRSGSPARSAHGLLWAHVDFAKQDPGGLFIVVTQPRVRNLDALGKDVASVKLKN